MTRADTRSDGRFECTERPNLIETIDGLHQLVSRCAEKAIMAHVQPALTRLLGYPAFQGFDDERSGRGLATNSANFLDQFFWARWDESFGHWQEAFDAAIRKACARTVGKAETWEDLTFDLISTAAKIERDGLSIGDFEAWAVEALFQEARVLLLNGNMDTVKDWGVAVPDQDGGSDAD